MKANTTSKAYLFRMNKKSVEKILQEISDTDKQDLKELLQATIGKTKRKGTSSNDKREWIPLFHRQTETMIVAEGRSPEGIELSEGDSFTIKKGNWSLDVYTTQLVAEYVDWWCPQQTACLNFKNERMALFTNDSFFFKNSFVISLATQFSKELAAFINSFAPELQTVSYTEEDFACTAEFGVSKQMFEKSAQYNILKMENMIKRFREKKEIDTTTPFSFEKGKGEDVYETNG